MPINDCSPSESPSDKFLNLMIKTLDLINEYLSAGYEPQEIADLLGSLIDKVTNHMTAMDLEKKFRDKNKKKPNPSIDEKAFVLPFGRPRGKGLSPWGVG